MRRPHINTHCVADQYCDKTRERIAEFEGGLIAIRRQDDGTILVNLYRLDKNVRVAVDSRHLVEEDGPTL